MESISPRMPVHNTNHDSFSGLNQAEAVRTTFSPLGLVHRATDDSLVEHDTNLSQHWAAGVKDLAQASKSKVAVLLLAWRENEGRYTVSTSESLKALKEVFEDQYNFHVRTETLTTTEALPRFQLTSIISEFLREYARSNTLLIVYYGGHGNLSPDGQDLILRGGNVNPKNPDQTELNWNVVEPLLYSIQADLLLLFDCCHAGLVARRSRKWPVSTAQFEFIGSTTKDKKARGPKDGASFTKSLISAFRDLSTRPNGFDTATLMYNVENNQDFQSSNQQPVLSNCGARTSQEKIWIRPLSAKPVFETEVEQLDRPNAVNFYLQFKYVFTQKPSEADLTSLKQSIWSLIRNQRLPIQDVLYGGLSRHQTRMGVADAVLLLLRVRGYRSRLPEGRLEVTASEQSTQMTTKAANMPSEGISTSSKSSVNTLAAIKRTNTPPEVVFQMQYGPTMNAPPARRLSFAYFDVLVLGVVIITWWLLWRMS